ncbi:FAD-dependent oxidoreductase [Bacilliculturomica massiliensis]|uniref:FAD-dependent oxidoreductase n=1 Tax=Bacilliculturomica massiliensis TaxID=1917867 RepID=UPI0010306C5A|nr:FAD-dependent oxidoreductase [Bacilliculturomica massiliensis]
MESKQLTKDLYWIGTLDPELRVFDIIMETKFGTSYNSYLLRGSEKTAIFETAKAKCFECYYDALTALTDVDKIEYIIINHTEPDHSGSIEMLLDINPGIKLVGTAAAVNFAKEICNRDFNSIIVKDGDTLSLGNKTLRFIAAPNLHWPDSMYTYIEEEKALVTCDSFGAHYALDEVTNDKITNREDYMEALRYYFDMIMGPFKKEVLAGIKKIEDIGYEMICPGHGPVLVQNPQEIVGIYKNWATEFNPNPKKTVVMPYVSAYGYTGMLAEEIEKGIRAAGDIDVHSYDLVTADVNEVLSDMYWADGLLFGTPTIVGEALKPVWDLTTSIFARTHGKKLASAFGSYGWSGEGVPHIMERLKQLNMKVVGEGLKVRFKPNEAELAGAYEFGFNFGASVLAGKVVEAKKPGAVKKWRCLICGEVVEGEEPPAACPVCGVGPEQFVEVTEPDVTFRSKSQETIIVVGNGAAGTAAVEEIRKRNKTCRVEMISREPVPGYNRPMLTKGLLSELDELNLYIKSHSWYQLFDVKLTLGTEVTAVDPDKKTLTLSDGTDRTYDKLILATGAESFVPPIKGADLPGVFTIRSLEDVKKIQAYMEQIGEAVVIGGGVLGLEAAWELCKAGKSVSVVEMGPGLMGRQLDDKGSELLRQAAERAGAFVYTGKGIEEICADGSGAAAGVKLNDGTLVPGALVILSTGVKQNIELGKAAGAQTGRSIVVNEKMETGVKDIYACGDCAEFEGANYAIWAQAVDMGKVAGINAVGDEAVYRQVIPSNAFSGFRLSLFAVGDNGKDAQKKYKTMEITDEAKGTYEKLYFVNNRFCGGILMGDVNRSARLLEAYKNSDPLEKLL